MDDMDTTINLQLGYCKKSTLRRVYTMIWMILNREMNPKNIQWHGGNIPIFTTRKNLGFHPHSWFLGHCVWGELNTWFEWLMSEMNVSLNRVAQQKISHMARGLLKAWRQKWGGYLVQLSGWSLFPDENILISERLQMLPKLTNIRYLSMGLFTCPWWAVLAPLA